MPCSATSIRPRRSPRCRSGSDYPVSARGCAWPPDYGGRGPLILGGLLWSWLGHLPGDLRFGAGSMRVYIPLGSSVLVSVHSSLCFAIVSRFMRH
ncbi:MAG: DUF2905 family protein [Acetobacteraceae bacterium]